MALFKIVLRSFKIQPAVQQYPCKDAEQGHLEEENSDHARLSDAVDQIVPMILKAISATILNRIR